MEKELKSLNIQFRKFTFKGAPPVEEQKKAFEAGLLKFRNSKYVLIKKIPLSIIERDKINESEFEIENYEV